ncbi:MAG: tetratricopeptide repeat protein [Candidatus Altiarchaeota archaeon]
MPQGNVEDGSGRVENTRITGNLRLGGEALDNRHFGLAKQYFSEAVRIDPKSAVARNNLGVACFRNGDVREAKEALMKAVELDPSYPSPHNNLGVVYESTGKIRKAKGEYETALRLCPDYKDAQHNLDRITAKGIPEPLAYSMAMLPARVGLGILERIGRYHAEDPGGAIMTDTILTVGTATTPLAMRYPDQPLIYATAATLTAIGLTVGYVISQRQHG